MQIIWPTPTIIPKLLFLNLTYENLLGWYSQDPKPPPFWGDIFRAVWLLFDLP